MNPRLRSAFVSSLLILLSVACGGGPDSTPGQEAGTLPVEEARAEPAPSPDLRTCPKGDSAWGNAVRQSSRDGSLEALLELAGQVASENPDRWEPVWARAECLHRLGRPVEAAGAARRSLEAAVVADDRSGIALNRYRLGWIAYRAGEFDTSDGHYREAVESAEATGRQDLLAQVLNGYAGLLVETGRYGEAHVAQGRAVDALRELGMAGYARMASLNRAVILMLLGDAVSAGRILESIQEEATAAGDAFVAPRAALTLGNLHRRMRRYEEAQRWYGRVNVDDSELASLAGLGRGLVAMRLGRPDEARAHLEASLKTTTPVHALLVRAHLAELDMEEGRQGAARERLAAVLAEARGTGAEEVLWIANWIRGRTWLAQGRHREAAEPLREARAELDEQGSELDPMAEGLRYLRERSDVYSDLAAAICGEGMDRETGARAADLFSAVESTHARALRHVFSGSGERARPADLETIRQGLGADEILLDFAVGRERGVVLALDRRGLTARPVPGWDDLGEPLRRYRSALLRPLRSAEAALDPMADLDRSMHHGQALVRALLEPVRDRLDGIGRIWVVPDRELALLPFAALPVPPEWPAAGESRFLGDFVEIAMLPLAGSPPAGTAPRPPVILAGDPVPGGEGALPRLPRAATEISRIAGIWTAPEGDVFLGDALRSGPLRDRLAGGVGMVHLATHAVASTSDPGRCAVHLSAGDRLGLDDIAELRLGSTLVVLSACSTGEGELVPGEGVVGLAWAFLRAGSDTVAASLWNVEDDSATRLMVSFHRFLKEGRDPVSALTLSRRFLAGQRPHPAYWAPFVVIARPGDRPRGVQ